jgi:putative oxidoreductase
MNFTGTQKGEGIEYFIYAVGIALALVVAGPGRFAVLRKM